MFWDQTLSLAEHLQEFSKKPVLGNLFVFFEVYDVFHSWWFGVVVLLLALNLIACSIERLPKIWIEIHNPNRILTDKLFKKMPLKFQTPISRVRALEFIKQFTSHKHYKIEHGNETYIYHEKHKYARTGVYIVHIALLMIMFGSIATTNWGIDGTMMIVEGQKDDTVFVKGPGGLNYQHKIPFNVYCDDFRLKTYVDGSPMSFESDLRIKGVTHQTIRVNEPLQYAGYTFYQASYQAMDGDVLIKLSIGPHGAKQTTYTLPMGGKAKMVDGTVLIPIEIMEDYGGLGTAVKIKQMDEDGKNTSFVVFRQYPDFDSYVRRGKWDVHFQGFDQTYATGVSVARVPLIEVVFGGFMVMFIGLYMAFFMSHRKYLVRIKNIDKNNCELMIAGIARRHPQAFVEEFNKLIQQVK